MRIGIDVRPTLKQKTGIGYYTLNLINHLARIDSRNKYLLYSRIKPLSRSKHVPPLPGANFRHRINYFSLPPGLVVGKVDAFFTSSHDLPKWGSGKFVVAVHDVIHRAFPQGHTTETIERSIKEIQQVLKYADKLITISNCTKGDLIKWYSVPEDMIKVIYQGADEYFHPIEKSEALYQGLAQKYALPDLKSGFILYVGTIEPRKNLANLIKAYHIIRTQKGKPALLPLVIAGMKGWIYSDVFELVKKLNLQSNIFFTGYVPREDLKAFYNLASVFVYPSFYEGAGVPVLEAFKCGVPVITSNASALTEIAADAAVLIDPHNPEEIARAIIQVIEDNDLRSDLIDKGLERTKRFNWDNTAQEMLKVFSEKRHFSK